ncbi:MAG: cytochrome c [Chloroflexota bacterium]|nr:MAG: cytochrome c [Chloroflexota bacterium]
MGYLQNIARSRRERPCPQEETPAVGADGSRHGESLSETVRPGGGDRRWLTKTLQFVGADGSVRPGGGSGRWLKWTIRVSCSALIAFALTLLLGGCAGGKYIFDWFPEMHYEPSYRAQEPPVRDVPPGAVPAADQGGTQLAQTTPIPNPLNFIPSQPVSGERLFQINCVPCHGQSGKGDGMIAPHFRAAGVTLPADLTSGAIQQRSDESLYGSITNGKHDPQTLVGMPPFRSLLTPDERLALVGYIRKLGGQ